MLRKIHICATYTLLGVIFLHQQATIYKTPIDTHVDRCYNPYTAIRCLLVFHFLISLFSWKPPTVTGPHCRGFSCFI